MLVIKRKINIIKQPGKKDNVCQKPPTSHNFLKIIIQKTILKTFSTSTCIIAKLGCRLKRVWMPKEMAS